MAVLSISRQLGAGGKTLAEMLAKRLGYEFVDEELISMVAHSAGIDVEEVEKSWRQPMGKSQDFISSLVNTDIIGNLLGKARPGFTDKDFFALLNKIIPQLAARDKVIFLGRASQFILPNNEKNIKVLLVGHEDNRVNFMVENYDMNRSEARKLIREWDMHRTTFLKKCTSGDPNDLSNYHITINTDKIKLDWARDMICDLVASRDKTTVKVR